MGQSQSDRHLERMLEIIDKSQVYDEQISSCKLCRMIMKEYHTLSESINQIRKGNDSPNVNGQQLPFLKKRMERLHKWIMMIKTTSKNNFLGTSSKLGSKRVASVTTKLESLPPRPHPYNISSAILPNSESINQRPTSKAMNSPHHNTSNASNPNESVYLSARSQIRGVNDSCDVIGHQLILSGMSLNYSHNSQLDKSNHTDAFPKTNTTTNGILSDATIEEGLRRYFYSNKDHFIERVSKGPPECFRVTSWMIIKNLPLNRNEGLYNFLLNKSINDIYDNAIKRDLNRTFPKNEQLEGERLMENLYRVLKAFAIIDNEILYCQGMNFIVGFLLMLSEINESEVFYLLLSMFSETFDEIEKNTSEKHRYSIRGFFSEEFPLLNLFLFQFDKIFEKKLPNLRSHFNKLNVPQDVWISKWYQTLFTIILPIDWCKRLWDCMFSFGITFMFNFSIALLKELQDELLQIEEAIGVLSYFQTIQKTPLSRLSGCLVMKCNIEKLISSAKKVDITNSLLLKWRKMYESENSIVLDKLLWKKYDLNYVNIGSANSNFTEEPDENIMNEKSENAARDREAPAEDIEEDDQNNLNFSIPKENSDGFQQKIKEDNLISRKFTSTAILEGASFENYNIDMDEKILFVPNPSQFTEECLTTATHLQTSMTQHILNRTVIKTFLDETNELKRSATANSDISAGHFSPKIRCKKEIEMDLTPKAYRKSHIMSCFSENSYKRSYTNFLDQINN